MEFTNDHDPLRAHLAGDTQKELFVRLAAASNDFSTEDVIGAAANLIVNALRQAHSTDRAAMARVDELTARLKGVLSEHYDRATGKRRNGIFPFNQVIKMPHVVDDDKFLKPGQ